MLEFDASIIGGKAPIDLDGLVIACALPRLNLTTSLLRTGNTVTQAMLGEHRELNFSHI